MDNPQQNTDWTVQLQQLQCIKRRIVDFGFLGEALRDTGKFLVNFHDGILESRLEEIENTYRLICDFFKQGYQDDKRQQLYDKLLGKLYRLVCDIEVAYRKLNDPSVLTYVSTGTAFSFDIERIRRPMESFVSDIVMTSLDSEDVRKEKEKKLHAIHHQNVQAVFSELLFSPHWPHEFAISMADLITSPTIDTNDAQLLVTATMLGTMLSGDPERLLTLLQVYEQVRDVHVRQRALVGWAFSLNGQQYAMFPKIADRIHALLDKQDVREELLELQIQMVYCRNAKRDNEKLQKEIMPGLLYNQNFEVDGLTVREQEDRTIDDILNPNDADRKMEEMEKNIRKIMDMRDRGVDVYFSGFSQMKRFSFFYTLCNWFLPFYAEHPQLQHLDASFLQSGMVKTILDSGSFCDSDKYSFVLGTSSVFHRLPDNIREMLNSGDVSMMGMPEPSIDIREPSFIRRMYLQNLYRFFSLCDARKMFENPFEPMQYLFMGNDVFRGRLNDEARRVQQFLLKQKMFASLSYLFYAYKDSENIEDMRMEAVLKMRERKYIQAQAIYARICELLPEDEQALVGYAQACFYGQDYEEASRLYGRLYRQNPDNRHLALNFAISQVNSDEAEEGMKTLYRLDYEDGEDLSVKRALAWGHMWLLHVEQADALYRGILKSQACNSTDYLNAGYCNWFSGKVGAAVDLIRQSVVAADNAMNTPEDIMRQFEKDASLLNKYGIGHVEKKLVAELVAASNRQ